MWWMTWNCVHYNFMVWQYILEGWIAVNYTFKSTQLSKYKIRYFGCGINLRIGMSVVRIFGNLSEIYWENIIFFTQKKEFPDRHITRSNRNDYCVMIFTLPWKYSRPKKCDWKFWSDGLERIKRKLLNKEQSIEIKNAC